MRMKCRKRTITLLFKFLEWTNMLFTLSFWNIIESKEWLLWLNILGQLSPDTIKVFSSRKKISTKKMFVVCWGWTRKIKTSTWQRGKLYLKRQKKQRKGTQKVKRFSRFFLHFVMYYKNLWFIFMKILFGHYKGHTNITLSICFKGLFSNLMIL